MTNTYRRTIIDRWRRENENDNIIGVLQPRAVRAIHDPCTCACARSCMCAAEKYAPRRIRFGSRSRRERSRTWSGATFLPFSSCIECETRVGWINTIVLQTRSPFPRIYRRNIGSPRVAGRSSGPRVTVFSEKSGNTVNIL